jgi:hypothetical protein
MGGTCSAHEKNEKYIALHNVINKTLEKETTQGDPGVDGWIILKSNLKKEDVRV